MKARSKPTEKRERSVFSTIFISVLVILAVEVTLLIGSIAVSRVPQQLDRNAEDILAKQVENRSRYLEDFLVQAQNLGDMPNRINEKTEALLTSGQISKDTLGQSSASSEPLLEAIADDLVTQLRSSSVTAYSWCSIHAIWMPARPMGVCRAFICAIWIRMRRLPSATRI